MEKKVLLACPEIDRQPMEVTRQIEIDLCSPVKYRMLMIDDDEIYGKPRRVTALSQPASLGALHVPEASPHFRPAQETLLDLQLCPGGTAKTAISGRNEENTQ
ncbi:hypothetical protein E2C01_041387 [Portunus trituberculatus]|uniref:Uncharacterized protein n=1 Tax=Portunus trituberculatus TaxID=210409 RepID=A0A5B7FQA4_PORTR|nr:hypothetical protein [Portunus trituberculatus]